MCFWIEDKWRDPGNLSQITLANPESNYRISMWPRPRETNKRTRWFSPLASKRPIPNVADAINCVTAIRTGRNEIRRIARIVRLCLGTLDPYDLFHPVARSLCREGLWNFREKEKSTATPRIANLWRTPAHSSDVTCSGWYAGTFVTTLFAYVVNWF